MNFTNLEKFNKAQIELKIWFEFIIGLKIFFALYVIFMYLKILERIKNKAQIWYKAPLVIPKSN